MRRIGRNPIQELAGAAVCRKRVRTTL